jgi:putative hydrolase
MIDLHTHSLFSDGELLPSELIRRFEEMGYSCVAITDHVDSSNLDFVVPRMVQVAKDLNPRQSVRLIPGVEITHVPPVLIESLVIRARELGAEIVLVHGETIVEPVPEGTNKAEIVLVHGETIVEPVPEGTNKAAILSGVDILAHPGLISREDVELAVEKGVYLEISSRQGHSLTNGHVARLAKDFGARLVLNSDAHRISDLMTRQFAHRVARGSGLGDDAIDELLANSRNLVDRIG